ncbi:UNVERIFIED_CONTAM: cytochrome [Sesamum latifolium]|uniref:Cytochrome n=1 Tax=Sesamum latifolium TaxID=2727402 RepID=A0AAW2SLZ3_9LAMI
MFPAAFYIGALLIIAITNWLYHWRNPRCNGVLPPGSMGWPLIGETLQFFAPNTSSDIPPFVKQRMQRYGPVFKTSLVGRPVIVSTDADLNYSFFNKRDNCFRAGSLHGFMYKYLKNMVLNLFGPESLKKMLPEVEQASNRNLEKWTSQSIVEVKEATAKMIFDLTAKKLISYDSEKSTENLRENFVAFIQGLISFPVDIPGTAYHKCLQGRKKAMKMLKNMLQERRENRENFETTSLALTLATKFLVEHPLVLKQLTEEHEAIVKRRENPDSGLTWSEYKSMRFTFQFINETVRLANIVPGIFRKAMRETKFKGYTIPAGWAIMVCPPAVHLDPKKYRDPLEFNPWRWEGIDTNGASRNFMAFGGGMRFCVGTDFTKVQMAVFLHCLVTKYKWKAIKGGDILRTPGLQFPNGFHIHISEKDK